ncbi:hypothetical protein AVEN_4807-1 [Araneus ventricosus]|uniref:Uncharacterized protein n=1 Tax=Araneus ventricosus TaxID=182803 RepID=A0A4Y2NVG4_ARAVE|nr:hypothetical protein AVEN_4807-1 [Araneus ventricosus]
MGITNHILSTLSTPYPWFPTSWDASICIQPQLNHLTILSHGNLRLTGCFELHCITAMFPFMDSTNCFIPYEVLFVQSSGLFQFKAQTCYPRRYA